MTSRPGLLLAGLMMTTTGVPEARASQVELRDAAFGPGEQTTYRVTYLGMTAGVAQITVGAETRQWGEQVWPIVTIARSDPKLIFYPIRDRFVTYWDAGQRRSIGSELFANQNNKRRRQRIRFDHEAGSAVVVKQKEGEGPEESVHVIELGSADVAAATFALRTMPLAVGKEFQVPIFTGSKSFMLKARVEAREVIETPVGRREVFRIRTRTEFSGKLGSKRDMFAYLTTDAARVPVKVEAEFIIGSVVAELTDYKRGRAPPKVRRAVHDED